jgi:hypothetical protein
VGKNFLLYLVKPLIEEMKRVKMALTLDGKDFGVDFYKKNLKKFMSAVENWVQNLPAALNSSPRYTFLSLSLSHSDALSLSSSFLFRILSS